MIKPMKTNGMMYGWICFWFIITHLYYTNNTINIINLKRFPPPPPYLFFWSQNISYIISEVSSVRKVWEGSHFVETSKSTIRCFLFSNYRHENLFCVFFGPIFTKQQLKKCRTCFLETKVQMGIGKQYWTGPYVFLIFI